MQEDKTRNPLNGFVGSLMEGTTYETMAYKWG